MMLTERVAVPDAALPVQAFRDHLRLGTGFAGLGEEDAALAGFLRAAIAAIEGRTAKALIAREFRLSLGFWRDPAGQPLPLAPVSAVVAVRLLDGMGTANDLPQGLYRLVQDSVRPRLVAAGGCCPIRSAAGRSRSTSPQVSARSGRLCPPICGRRSCCLRRNITRCAMTVTRMGRRCPLAWPR